MLRAALGWMVPIAIAAALACGASQAADSPCTGSCADKNSFLAVAQIERIIARAVAEAEARGAKATIAVVDRVGNVLAVFQMDGAATLVRIRSGRFNNGRPAPLDAGLEEVPVPASLAAIAKAITAAYLSSEGNAFTTRTANQIVQEFFNPGEIGQPSGPLFGVQFSQLPCGDLVQQGARRGIGPRRSPLGLSADPGGLPLYLRGTPVGGIGVMADGIYGGDANIGDRDSDLDELIALAGTAGLEAPPNRRADRIAVIGLLLRFADRDTDDLRTDPGSAPAFNRLAGRLIDAPGFFVAARGIRRGTAFGQPASGIEPAGNVDRRLFQGLDAFVLTDGASNNRFPARSGARNDGQRLRAREVRTILAEGIKVANSARAQIRQPNGSQVRVTVSVVDINGRILGIARTRDAPVFGIDVSLQKARAAAFFSDPGAAAALAGAANPQLGAYVRASQRFVSPPFGGPLFADGTAFSNRAIGNLARPFFPDGILSETEGPLSKPFDRSGVFKPGSNEWSVFNVGIQLDLVRADVFASLGLDPARPPPINDCSASNAPSIALGRLANGIQIFPGSVPVYKRGVFVGAAGVSGDGVDQDDMVAFLSVNNASRTLGGVIKNASIGTRADRVTIDKGGDTVRLRYVQCPVAPFRNSQIQNPCNGK